MSDVAEPPGRRHAQIAQVLAGVSLFIASYLALFLPLAFAAAAFGERDHYWIALLSAAAATWITVRVVENGSWSIGVLVDPRHAARELFYGFVFSAIVIGGCDALIITITRLHHVAGNGFPWRELVAVFIPAAVHEEIVFRGYIYQRIRAWNRPAAIALTAVVFALLHATNRGITLIAVANLVLAGVLLALAYERYGRLWFPIGIHFAWNVISGPILGYDVSGFVADATVVRTAGIAPPWLGGGAFGIEGSVLMTLMELLAIAFLVPRRRAIERSPAAP